MVETILGKQAPKSFIYAPNYWQWFAHHKNHGILPHEIRHCNTQLDLIRHLGLDVMSRNIYSDQQKYWFGGICDEYFDSGIEKKESRKTNRKIHWQKQPKLQTRNYTMVKREPREDFM